MEGGANWRMTNWREELIGVELIGGPVNWREYGNLVCRFCCVLMKGKVF